jgi:hypothetical protein
MITHVISQAIWYDLSTKSSHKKILDHVIFVSFEKSYIKPDEILCEFFRLGAACTAKFIPKWKISGDIYDWNVSLIK